MLLFCEAALPKGWTVEVRQRKSGSTAGVLDAYYYSPGGECFRSLRDAQKFMDG